ncbi:oxygen-regulated protein 1 [Scyliorhinus torazame]|uniref:oxygen-regulated protein 1 n=1 Tax=Scyliorhinus torazame TaxID=75743 RepID=UPI003B5A61CA
MAEEQQSDPEQTQISKISPVTAQQFQGPSPVKTKKIYFYKSGDPQFSGIRMSINSRSFKTFDSLLDNLSRKIPLPFGVRTIATPRGGNSVTSLSDLKDGQSYICSDQRKVKPINLDVANRKQDPWFISRPFNPEEFVSRQIRQRASKSLPPDLTLTTGIPKKLVVFRNGDPSFKRNLVLNRNRMLNFDVLLNHISELMNFPVLKLYTTNGKRIDALYPVKYKFEAMVAAGREGYRLRKYADSKSPQIPNRVQHKNVIKTEKKNHGIKLGRRQWLINSVSPSSSKTQGYTTSPDQFYMNDNKIPSGSSFYFPENETDAYKNYIYAREEKTVIPSEDDIEKSIFVNEDGSITVEMRVHLQIKEKETIQWTTTINRSSMCNRKSNACKAKLESNVESADLPNVHSHYNSETMHFENLDHEQDFDDLCTPQKYTGQIEHDKGGHYDIWQNSFLNTNEDLPELGAEFKPLYYCKESPGHGKVTQDQVSLESMTANPDTGSGANIVQLSNLEEPGLGESIIENCNEHFSISNTKETCERSSDTVSEALQTWKEVNVNNQGEEKIILDKNTSVVGKASSSKYSELCHEDQYTVLKMINSHNESTNARNMFLRYWEEIGCDDTDNNVTKLNLRPTSADATYSNSKRGIKHVKRPTSASFKYSRSYASIHNEKSSLSSRMGCSHTSTERMDINTNCTYSSESCEARMSLFLEDLNSVSKCSQSSTVRNQDCTKTSDEVEMPINTGSNNSSSTNEDERAFCSSEEASPVNNDFALSSRTDEQNCRDHTSELSKLCPEYSNHSQQPQLLGQHEETDILSDDCTTHSSSQEAIEMVDTDKYQSTEFNPVEMSNEINVTFHIENGGDGSVSHNSTGVIPPKEETNSDLSWIPIVCPAGKEPSNAESLDSKLQRMEDQSTLTISNSSATPSKSENISEADICQDNFSEGKQTTLLIACTEFSLYQAEGVQCSAIITEENSDLPESSSLRAEIDCDSSSAGNKKQITGVNSSSIESDIQQNSSNPSRKNWTKKNGKILNISTAGRQNFKTDAESSKSFSILMQQKEQEIYDVDIPQAQTFVRNRLRMSATSEIVCCDFNLRSYPQTQFEEERTVDLGSNIIKESNKLPDDDSDFINQTKSFGSEIEVPVEHRLVQISAKAVSDVKRVYEVPDDCNNDDLLQSQVSAAKGEVKPAPIPNEIQYRTITKVTDAKLDVIDFAKETVDTAIQNGIGLDSEMVEEKDPIGEHDLSQVLCKLQSAVDVIKCNSEHRFKTCPEKSYERPDMSEHLAATLSTSSKVLLAWLAIMNLNVNVPASPDRAKLLMNNCNCSYIITFLQSIRHVIKLQETDDLKQCIPSLQKYASQFVKVWQNEHKEEPSCAFENGPKIECPVQTGTLGVENVASFDVPQLINTIENEKYLYTQNVIEQLEHVDEAELKEDVKYVANILSIKEDKTKETDSKVPELLSSKDNSFFSDLLEDQIRTNSLFQNEDAVEETTVMSKKWVEKETVERDNCTNGCDSIEEFASLQHIEDMRREDVAKNKEFLYNNCINSNKNRHSGKLRDNETNNHFTCANAAEKTDDLSTASDTIHLQNKISLQSFLHHKSPLANDICESKHTNVFCQRECIRRSNSYEIPACRLSALASVVSDNDIENGKKTGNKQLTQTREICENPFSEGEAGIKKSLPCTYPSMPSNRNVKQCLERQQTSDLSEENQEIASDYNSQASNEMTTEGEDDVFVKTKHFSANFVRKATEKLYGKSHVVSKHFAYDQPPYVCVEPKAFFQTGSITDNISCKISSRRDKSMPAGTWGINNELLHISSLDKGRTFENSQENSAQSESDGAYIEKGRWFLKENHLVRKSPPLNMGMYGNLDTTSVDTAFDNTSDDSAYSHVNTMHSGPPLSELSSSDIEGTKSKPMCNYFNMSHGSDSEPFPDLISEKSYHAHICSGSHLTKKNDSNKQSARVPVGPTGMYAEANDNDSSFMSAEFHMFDNKVSPMVQPLAQGTVVEQPSRETVRTLQNPDSRDKLHFLCGQHCPILTAVIDATNEESRRFVYQKKSDLENQWILHSESGADISDSGKYNDLVTRKENCSVLNKHSIDGTISDIIHQFKSQSFENDIKRIKLSLDAKYFGANLVTSKVPVYSEETESKHKDKPFCSNIQAEKLCLKRIVEQWFMKQAVENKIKAVKGRENGLSFRKGEDYSGRQTDPYIRHTRGNTANNYVTIPLLENKVIGQTMSSGNISTNEAAVNSEKEPFCERHKEKLEKHNK